MWAEGSDICFTHFAPGRKGGMWWLYAKERQWPISQATRARLALWHEPEASSSPDGFRLATCVMPVCQRPMVAMWHLWLDAGGLKKEIHMCAQCATDYFGAPTPGYRVFHEGEMLGREGMADVS